LTAVSWARLNASENSTCLIKGGEILRTGNNRLLIRQVLEKRTDGVTESNQTESVKGITEENVLNVDDFFLGYGAIKDL